MRKGWIWTGLVLILIAGSSYGLYVYLQPAPLPPQLLYGSGHVEGTEVHVAAEIGGRVIESGLVEGQAVEAGTGLVTIDHADLQLRKERAEAHAESLRYERERIVQELEVARHHLKTAKADLSRYQELRARDATSRRRLEQAENAYQEAEGRVDILTASIKVIGKRIEAAEREVDLLENQIMKTLVSAPIDGTVLTKAVEVGEYVRPGQTVAMLVDLSRLELKVFVPEKHIGKVKLQDPARVRVDAFPQRVLEGRVARIDQQAQFTPRDIHMPEERTRMVFGVTIALDNLEGVLKPGMPADAWILWRSEAGWPDRLPVP